jgi:hypothetical protein
LYDRGGNNRPTRLHTTDARDLLGYLAAEKDSSVPGFGTLRKLDLDHFHGVSLGFVLESCRIEATILRPAAKIAAANLPDQVTARIQVVRADAPFAGVEKTTGGHKKLKAPTVRMQTNAKTKKPFRMNDSRGQLSIPRVSS